VYPRRILAVVVVLSVLAGGLAITAPVGTVVAEHGESPASDEIIEVQRVSTADTEAGSQQVVLEYHIGSEVVGLEVAVRDRHSEVVSLEGFRQTEDGWYEWDEVTENPKITILRESNRSVTRQRGLDFAETGEWTLTDTVGTLISWSTFGESIDVDRTLDTQAPGLVGTNFAYLGPYERHTVRAGTETFEIVVSNDTDPDRSIDSMADALSQSSGMLDVGAESDSVAAFVVTDPIRRGGLASGVNQDLWVHEDGLEPPRTVLRHEYVHTRQDFNASEAVEWTVEAEADYYGPLLALKQGAIEYHDFHASLAGADEAFPEVVLAEPETWRGSFADYELGSLVVANLDREIRAASGGSGSYEDVLRVKNDHGREAEITDSEYEGILTDAAGVDLGTYLDRHVRTTAGSIDVPAPTVYDTGPDEAGLALEATATTVQRGEDGRLRFELTNTGSEPSLAPTLSLSVPDAIDGELSVNGTAGVDSGVTDHEAGRVFDHLAPGERLVLEYAFQTPSDATVRTHQIDAAVEDMGENTATGTGTVDVTVVPETTLQSPQGAPVGEQIELVAEVRDDGVAITGYQWEVTGPAGRSVDTDEGELGLQLGTPGEYTIDVTARNELGAVGGDRGTVVVSDIPELTVDAPSRVTVSEPEAFIATVENDFGEYEIEWTAGEQRQRGERVEFAFEEPGDRDVRVTVTDEYGAETSETVTVSVRERADGQASDDATTDANGAGATADGGDDPAGSDAGGPGFGILAGFAAVWLLVLASRHRRT
jgi:predicted transcriptional regulator